MVQRLYEFIIYYMPGQYYKKEIFIQNQKSMTKFQNVHVMENMNYHLVKYRR